MHSVLFDQTVHTDYGQFSLEWGDDSWDADERFFDGQQNGWVAAAVPGVIHVLLARQFGGSSVVIELDDGSPDDPMWEDCVEVSCRVAEGAKVRWTTFAAESAGVVALPPNDYRLRVSANGRAEGNAHPGMQGLVDFYLLQFWPAPWSPDEVVRVGGDESAYWHRTYGSRRDS